jgi:hypothetical protein
METFREVRGLGHRWGELVEGRQKPGKMVLSPTDDTLTIYLKRIYLPQTTLSRASSMTVALHSTRALQDRTFLHPAIGGYDVSRIGSWGSLTSLVRITHLYRRAFRRLSTLLVGDGMGNGIYQTTLTKRNNVFSSQIILSMLQTRVRLLAPRLPYTT